MQDLDSERVFDLQVDDVLKSRSNEFGQAWQEQLLSVLVQIKDTLENLPRQKINFGPGAQFLDQTVKTKIPLEAQIEAPVRVDIIGSFLTKTLSFEKPGEANTDIAVEMSKTILWKESQQNFDYFDKRLIFLRALQEHLIEQGTLQFLPPDACLSVGFFQDDPLKPILEIQDMTLGTIRIIPTVGESSMKIQKLRGDRNCVRKEPGDKTPTPFYNQQILEDMHFRQHTEFLFSLFNEQENLKNACKLLKIWWNKRSSKSYGEINGFHLTMLMAYLIQR